MGSHMMTFLRDGLARTLFRFRKSRASKQEIAIAKNFVDPEFYCERYADIKLAGVDAVSHFVNHGWSEGRDPNPYTILNFVKKIYDKQINSFTSLAKLLCGEVYHNPLLRRPVTLAELRQAEDVGGSALNELFLFDVTKYTAEQYDVHVGWEIHPINHLFLYGLFENRLRSGGYLDPLLVPVNDFANDYELLAAQEEVFPAVTFKGIALPKAEKRDLSGIRLHVGVVLFNNSMAEISRLVRSLDSNAKGQEFSVHLWLWDNSPRPVDLQQISKTCANIQVEISLHPENVGFARGHNGMMECAFQAGATYYLGLNPDGFLLSNALHKLLCFVVTKKHPVLVEMESEPVTHPKWIHPISRVTDWVCGAAFVLDREAYERTSGFDPEFPMYCEDVDLSFRAKTAGVSLYVAPHACFYHDTTYRIYEPEQELWRNQRSLIGTLYLCEKWNNLSRAQKIRMQLGQLGVDLATTYKSPSVVKNITPEIQRLLQLARFSHSRFWT